jgi:hypothetical protein
MKQIRKNNYIRIRNSIIEENIRIELEKFLNEKRNIHEGILSDGYNFLRKISKSTLRILWEATKFFLRNIKEFFKKIAIFFKEIVQEYKKGDKTLYFLTISVAALSLYLVTKPDDNRQQHKEAEVQINQVEKKIIEKIKESKEVMTISFEDKEKIEKLCKLGEIKLFALETEDNYLCLPFEDEKSFKAIKVSNYYDLHFDITNEESNQILDMLLEFNKKGTTEFKRKIGNTPEFTYKIVEPNKQWSGLYTAGKHIQVVKNSNKFYMYETFAHEFIHYKDDAINKDKFSNNDIEKIKAIIDTSFKKNQIVTYEELSKSLNIQDKSAIRYLVSILQKDKIVDYIDNNFSKIKIKNVNQYNFQDEKAPKHYFATAIERNTHLSDVIHKSLAELENKSFNPSGDPLYIIKNYKNISGMKDATMFNNKQIERMIKGYENHKNNKSFVENLNKFLVWIWENENSTDFYADASENNSKQDKNFQKFLNSPLLMLMDYKESENQDKKEFLHRLSTEGNKITSETLQDIFKNRHLGISSAISDLNSSLPENKKKYVFTNNIKKKVDQIFDEIKRENKYEFNNKEQEERFYHDLLQNYTKKVFEKLKDYEENIEKNKEAYNKLKENILREYVRQLII